MTFALDTYEPVSFHTYPALMRAAEARTEVLQPVEPSNLSEPGVATAAPVPEKSVPVVAYLVGIGATAVLREQLADFLDAAGARRDVRVSVGVSGASTVSWVLRDAVPYGVRALPRYPPDTSAADPQAALEAAGAVLAEDAPNSSDRQLVVLVWDRPPTPVRLPASLATALVLHCVDAVLDQPPPDGQGPCWQLWRSRPRPPRSLMAQAGRLLAGWDAFTEIPDGLVLTRLG